MSEGIVVGIFAAILLALVLGLTWSHGRDTGREDVLDHGWRRKDRP